MKTSILLIVVLCASAFAKGQAGNTGLDPAFGKGGILVDTSYRTDGDINDIKLRRDGKILVLVHGYNGTSVGLYASNGSRDSSFSTDGSQWLDSFSKSRSLHGVVLELQQDEKILIAGRTYEWIGYPVRGGFVMRLHSDGAIDSAFGNNGIQYLKDETSLLCLKPDGSILTVGEEEVRDLICVNGFKPDGDLDSAFGVNGIFQIKPGNYPSLERISALADGRIAIIGGVSNKIYYVRLLSNGRADTTFGGAGICYTYGGMSRNDAIVYPNGETLVAVEWVYTDPPAIMRLKKTDATPDSSFGPAVDGLFYVPLPGFGIEALLQLPDGRIICAGKWNENFTIARVLKDGKGMDTTFGKGGIITTSLAGGNYERIHSAALQPDGKILAGGMFRVLESNPRNWHHVSAVVRYFSDARLEVLKSPQPAERTLKFYPNPARGSITVVVPAPGLLQVFSIDGKLLLERHSSRTIETLDIGSLLQGPYLLRLQTAEASYSSSFIKE